MESCGGAFTTASDVVVVLLEAAIVTFLLFFLLVVPSFFALAPWGGGCAVPIFPTLLERTRVLARFGRSAARAVPLLLLVVEDIFSKASAATEREGRPMDMAVVVVVVVAVVVVVVAR